MSVLKTKFAAKSAKTLLQNSTDAERKLWSKLRDRQLLGFKFVRQQPIGPFIADFACREADLVIELDGGQHAESAPDADRTAMLRQHGYDVMRFWNNDVLANIEGTLQVISERLSKAPSPGLRFAKPDLSPKGRGEDRSSDAPLTSPSGGEVDPLGSGERAFPERRSKNDTEGTEC